MSGQVPQPAHKVRPNVSPSQRLGPMKAVKAFALQTTRKSPSSPTTRNWHRRSPVQECRHSPDRRSPSSPIFKVERPKPVRLSPASSSLRRTGSLDTIGPYLKGQWPADVGGYHHGQQTTTSTFMETQMLDQGTQTPEEWPTIEIPVIKTSESKKKKKHRRSASFGHGDKLELSSIRQKLKTTKDQGIKQRQSPIPANHLALSRTAPAVLIRSAAIGIPNASAHISKAPMSRYQRNSVEGLNYEIEKLVLKNVSGTEDEFEKQIEGHRAPVPNTGTRSVDTQTPSGILDESGVPVSPASPASRPHSISPFIAAHLENSPRPSSSCYGDSSGSTPCDSEIKSEKDIGERDSTSPDGCNKIISSPKPNKIVREPPDGCEKVKVIDENQSGRPPSIKEKLLFCPIKGQGLTPSINSAFCPLTRHYTQGTSLCTRQTAVMEGQ